VTATLTIKSGVNWNSGATSFDLGTITDEEEFYNSGTTSIPISFSGSEGVYTYSLKGGERMITIRGIKFDATSSYATNLRLFTSGFKLISDYQSNPLSWSTYTNNKSHTNDMYNGVTVKIVDYRTSQNFRNSIASVIYTLRLIQTRSDV